MATKNTKKTSTRVSKKSKGPSTKLKIWVGVLIVLIVAVVGVVVVRFSEASRGGAFDGSVRSFSRSSSLKPATITIETYGSGSYYFIYAGKRQGDNARLWYSRGSNTCATITRSDDFKGSIYYETVYESNKGAAVWPQVGKFVSSGMYINPCYQSFDSLSSAHKTWWQLNGGRPELYVYPR